MLFEAVRLALHVESSQVGVVCIQQSEGIKVRAKMPLLDADKAGQSCSDKVFMCIMMNTLLSKEQELQDSEMLSEHALAVQHAYRTLQETELAAKT